MYHVEVDQQADPVATESQITQQLSLVDIEQLLDDLQLHYNFLLHQEIDLVPALDEYSVIGDWQPYLRPDTQPSF